MSDKKTEQLKLKYSLGKPGVAERATKGRCMYVLENNTKEKLKINGVGTGW